MKTFLILKYDGHQVVHGCHQFVFWYVRLGPLTNVTLNFSLYNNIIKYKFIFLYFMLKYRMWNAWGR